MHTIYCWFFYLDFVCISLCQILYGDYDKKLNVLLVIDKILKKKLPLNLLKT